MSRVVAPDKVIMITRTHLQGDGGGGPRPPVERPQVAMCSLSQRSVAPPGDRREGDQKATFTSIRVQDLPCTGVMLWLRGRGRRGVVVEVREHAFLRPSNGGDHALVIGRSGAGRQRY